MEETTKETARPQEGTWDTIKGYPKKLTFDVEKPVSVTFAAEFTGPKEMPNTDGLGVFYIFECIDGLGDKASISTSAWTLLQSLKSHEPLAGKNLVITKKNIKGKNLYYVNRPDNYGTPKIVEPKEVDTDDAGLSDGTI